MIHMRKKSVQKQNVQTEISPFPTPAKSRRRRCRTYPNMPRCQKAEKAPTGARKTGCTWQPVSRLCVLWKWMLQNAIHFSEIWWTLQHTIYCGCLSFLVYYTTHKQLFQGHFCSFVLSLQAKWRFAQYFSTKFVHYFFDISCFRTFMKFFDRHNQQMSQKPFSLSVTFCSDIL